LATLSKELVQNFFFVYLHSDKRLGHLRVEMVFLNRLHNIVEPDRLFFNSVEHHFPVNNPVETAHDSGMYKTCASVHIVIFNSGDQRLLRTRNQVFLYCPDLLKTAHILIKLRVDRHVLRPYCKSLAVLLFLFNVKDERDTRRILDHKFLKKPNGEVDALHYDRLIALVHLINHFLKLSLN